MSRTGVTIEGGSRKLHTTYPHIGKSAMFAVPDKTPAKKRPALVLTRNSAIAYLSTVTVAPVTSTIRGVPLEVVMN